MPNKTSGPAATTAWYVYGVQRAGTPVPAAAGVDAQPVRAVTSGRLSALVSQVDADTFDRHSGRAGDITWLGNQTFAHQSVLAAAFATGPVLPLDFGVVFAGEREVVGILQEHEDTLHAELDRVSHHSEWAVKVVADRKAVERALATLVPVTASGDRTSPGHASLARRRRAQALEAERRRASATVGVEVHERLAAASADAKTGRAQEPTSDQTGEIILSGVYLVQDESLPTFRAELAAVQRRHIGSGFSCVVTGPWPPRHFITVPGRGAGTGNAGGSPL